MKKWLNNVRYAWNGLVYFIRTELNGKIEFVITIVSLAICYWLKVTGIELAIILLCIGLIIAAEMFNTAIEKVCNYLTLEHHPEIGRIKDLAAGAVLVLAAIAASVGLMIFVPKILNLL